jgi:tetraacyldisaccharide 4'-kinase
VVDGQRGLGNRRLIPAGPLREPAGRLESVDAVVLTEPREASGIAVDTIPMHLVPGDPVRLRDERTTPMRSWRQEPLERRMLAVAGIGNSERFFDTLQRLGIDFEPRAFPDHHLYTAADFEGQTDRRIVMTEKDAVKCRQLALNDAWYLPVSAVLPEDWEREFLQRILSLAAGSGVK